MTDPDPLDLDRFAGFTPGPLEVHDAIADPAIKAEIHPAGDEDGLRVLADVFTNRHDAELWAAAPALLAECRRQRAEIEAMACGIADMLTAWDNATSASVKMRASAIAGLRGIIEHRQPKGHKPPTL